MNAISILMIVGMGCFLWMPPYVQPFVIMTCGSIALLSVLPHKHRHHIGKIGAYTHEVSHGVVSLMTGGEFDTFRIGKQGGGYAVTSGGKRKLIVSAGYIGTILLGAIMLSRSANVTDLTVTLYILALFFAVSTIKSGDLHTAVVGNVTALLLGLSHILMPGSWVVRFLLNFLGVILVWKGLTAIRDLYQTSTGNGDIQSDAKVMSNIAGHTTLHWVFVYASISVVILLMAIVGIMAL